MWTMQVAGRMTRSSVLRGGDIHTFSLFHNRTKKKKRSKVSSVLGTALLLA